MKQNNSSEVKLLTFLHESQSLDSPVMINSCIDNTDTASARLLIQQLLDRKYITVTSNDYQRLGVNPYSNMMAFHPKAKYKPFDTASPFVYAQITKEGIEYLKTL